MRRPLMLKAISAAADFTPLRSFPPRCLFSTSTAASGSFVAVKKVTDSNFSSAIEELRALVHASDFVAVDLEMTGVTSAPWREAFEFDRSDVRYSKVKDSAEKFAVVQFGICPFRWDNSKESFVAHPHNFYIFPRARDEFHCQTTSISFLAKYQFDFNACFYEGISYLSRAQEAEAFNTMSEKINHRLSDPMRDEDGPSEMQLGRTADVLFTERMKIQFHEWRNSIVKSQGVGSSGSGSSGFKSEFQTSFFKMRPAVMLSGFSSRQQRLIRMVIRRNFDDLLHVSAPGVDLTEQKQVVYMASKEDKTFLMKEIQNDLLNMSKEKLSRAVGFRRVIDLLSSEEKLLIGHNCFLDFAHVYSKFIGPLPSSITEFASALHENFAHVIDTRHILKANPAVRRLMKKSSTSLSSAFSLLCPHIPLGSHYVGPASSSRVKVEVETDASGSCSGAKHEAGYDAFMTGCIFAQACSHMGVDLKLLSASSALSQNPSLQNHVNLLYPSFNGGVVINLQTGKEIVESSRHLFKWRNPKMIYESTIILWGFPSTIQHKELKSCINGAFGHDCISSIFYLDSTSALIEFSSQELASEFLILKETLEKSDDAIRVLHPLSRLLDGGQTSAGSYEVYKELCCSQISKPSVAEQAEAMGIRWKKRKEDHASAFVAKNSNGDVGPDMKNPHHISCEDMLDSLYASHALVGR